MGADPAACTARTSQAQGRTPSRLRSRRIDRHSLRASHRHPVGAASPGDGLRVRDDLLASSARLAGRRGVEESLADDARRPGRVEPHRMVCGGDGQLLDEGAFWGTKTGPNPTDRSKNGTKRHLITDAAGTPLAIEHTAANVHESRMAIALVDAIPRIKQPDGTRRRQPVTVFADRAYDAEKIRVALRRRGIIPFIPKRRTEHGSGLGKIRYVIEAAFDWLFNNRRLRVRYEKRDDIHDAFLILGCLLICWRRVQWFC